MHAAASALKLLDWAYRYQFFTVAFSPNGNTLASGGDRTERSGDGLSAAVHSSKPLRGMRGSVRSVRFSPDGSTLASAGTDKLIRLWDVWSARSQANACGTFGASPHRSLLARWIDNLASGSRDGAIMLWDVQTGNKLHACLKVMRSR